MIEIVFEDQYLLIADKPAGLNFHSEGDKGLVVLLQEQVDTQELYPLHRLDKMTSGLIMFAKDKATAQIFSKKFEAREIEKYYLAISLRKPKKKQGWIKGDMQKGRRGDWMLLKSADNPAVTQFHSCALEVGERGFLLKPHTGKTHQLRVALKSLGSPIAGDLRYAHAHDAKLEDRGYLHAYVLRFEYNDKKYLFVSKPKEGSRYLSDKILHCLDTEWKAPWELF